MVRFSYLCHIVHDISMPSFTIGNRLISFFKYNYIREPIPETPEPIQKTSL